MDTVVSVAAIVGLILLGAFVVFWVFIIAAHLFALTWVLLKASVNIVREAFLPERR